MNLAFDKYECLLVVQQVMESLNFLAYETVAQIVDLALLVRRDADDVPINRYTTPTSLDPTHPNILLHGQVRFLFFNIIVKALSVPNFSFITPRERQVPVGMAIDHVEPMLKCSPKYLRMETTRVKGDTNKGRWQAKKREHGNPQTYQISRVVTPQNCG